MNDPYTFGSACAQVATMFSHLAVMHINTPNFPTKDVLEIVTKLNYISVKEIHNHLPEANQGYLQELALKFAITDLMGLNLGCNLQKKEPEKTASPVPPAAQPAAQPPSE